MNFSDKKIKLICPNCEVINDEDVIDVDNFFFVNGVNICWYCKKSFGWNLTQETIINFVKNNYG